MGNIEQIGLRGMKSIGIGIGIGIMDDVWIGRSTGQSSGKTRGDSEMFDRGSTLNEAKEKKILTYGYLVRIGDGVGCDRENTVQWRKDRRRVG